MCGRFSLHDDSKKLADYFGLNHFVEFEPSYNIAPSHQVPVVLNNMGERQSTLLTWGLVPSWAKDVKNAQINARVESVADKPFFRSAFKSRRCLVPVSNWFEWHTENNSKQPYCFRQANQQPLAIAGIWEHWVHENESRYSFALLTRHADTVCATIHDRMPVIVPQDYFERWLSPEPVLKQEMDFLIQPEPLFSIEIYPVSKMVNLPKNNSEQCIVSIQK